MELSDCSPVAFSELQPILALLSALMEQLGVTSSSWWVSDCCFRYSAYWWDRCPDTVIKDTLNRIEVAVISIVHGVLRRFWISLKTFNLDLLALNRCLLAIHPKPQVLDDKILMAQLMLAIRCVHCELIAVLLMFWILSLQVCPSP